MQSWPRMLPKSLYIESRCHIINENCGEAVRALKHASPPSLSVELGTVGLWNELSRDSSGLLHASPLFDAGAFLFMLRFSASYCDHQCMRPVNLKLVQPNIRLYTTCLQVKGPCYPCHKTSMA